MGSRLDRYHRETAIVEGAFAVRLKDERAQRRAHALAGESPARATAESYVGGWQEMMETLPFEAIRQSPV